MHRYDVAPNSDAQAQWRVHSRAYSYELTAPDGRDFARYDWHPQGQDGEDGAIDWPHLHARGYTRPVDVSRMHLPTGRVSLEAVIRLAIRDFKVPPRRPDWQQVLASSEQTFRQERTWA
jgi:hypothetical protein